MNPANAKLLVLSSVAFLLGLGTGATVFSNPPPATPPVAEAPATPTEPIPPPVTAMQAVAPVATPMTAEPPPAAPDPALTEQVASLMDGWGRLQAELADLRARVATLEQRPLTAAVAQTAPATPPADIPEQERDALVRAGLPPARADELINRRAEVALSQLELRDQAIREGWLGSERYREELSAINARQVSLRDELDPFTYDRFLYESGEPNRVRVDAVIPGSVGAENGLLPGDLIESYGEQRIFDYRELRDATAAGVRGELVPVQVRRGSQALEVWLPRGPIGIRLDSARVAP